MSRIAIGKDGVLKMDGVPLPCIVNRVGCRGKIVIDSSKVEGSSGRRKVFDGWDDWDLSIDATIIEFNERIVSRYDHLRTVNEAFKQLEDGLPVIYALESQLASSLNIRQVLFAGLDVTDDSGRDAVELSINFTEHDPVVGLVQRQQVEAEQAEAEAAAAAEQNAATDQADTSQGETVSESAYSQADLASLRRAEELYG